jgi:hypothetical protein
VPDDPQHLRHWAAFELTPKTYSTPRGFIRATLPSAPTDPRRYEEIAREASVGANARANEVELELRHGDAAADELPRVGLAVANIALTEVSRLAESLPAGRLIASGYRSGEAAAPRGFARIERRELDGWAAELFVRR